MDKDQKQPLGQKQPPAPSPELLAKHNEMVRGFKGIFYEANKQLIQRGYDPVPMPDIAEWPEPEGQGR